MKLRVISLTCFVLLILIVSCQSEEQIDFARYYSNGSAVYIVHCQNCHSAKGEGLQGLIPSLNDAAYLKKNKEKMACIVKNGLKGSINISKKQFDGEMPPSDLSPVEIAQVITYIANSFGNKLGTVTTEQVNADLVKCQ